MQLALNMYLSKESQLKYSYSYSWELPTTVQLYVSTFGHWTAPLGPSAMLKGTSAAIAGWEENVMSLSFSKLMCRPDSLQSVHKQALATCDAENFLN